jgi:hypothetical protein
MAVVSANPHSQDDLERVEQSIAPVVLDFCREGKIFHMADLATEVADRVGPIAPNSAGRILTLLGRAGRVNYRVIDRANSIYEVTAVQPRQEQLFHLGSPDRIYRE